MYFALHFLWALDAWCVLPGLLYRPDASAAQSVLVWLAGCLIVELLSRDRHAEPLPEWLDDSDRYQQLDEATEQRHG